MSRIIKRYQNRKLYDTQEHTYLTLSELGEVVKKDDIQVIDVRTGTDITAYTKLMIVFDSAKTELSSEDNEVLTKIIRSEQGLVATLNQLKDN